MFYVSVRYEKITSIACRIYDLNWRHILYEINSMVNKYSTVISVHSNRRWYVFAIESITPLNTCNRWFLYQVATWYLKLNIYFNTVLTISRLMFTSLSLFYMKIRSLQKVHTLAEWQKIHINAARNIRPSYISRACFHKFSNKSAL